MTIQAIAEEGDLVAVRVLSEGTNLGPLNGVIPPTGRRFSATRVTVAASSKMRRRVPLLRCARRKTRASHARDAYGIQARRPQHPSDRNGGGVC